MNEIIIVILFYFLLNYNKKEQENYKNESLIKISFCSTCMNRYEQLKEVLPKNLNDNRKYQKDIEFVLVNFIKDDEGIKIDNWIKNNCKNDIKSGYLKYLVNYKQNTWHASICKNTAHRYGNGIALYNLDCDNYLNPDEVSFLLKQNINDLIYNGWSGKWLDGTAGRICLSAKYFYYLGGYDENFYPSAYQDIDLLKRAEFYLNRKAIQNINFNKIAIKNTKDDNLKNVKNVKNNSINWQKMNELNKKRSKERIQKNNIRNNHLIGVKANLIIL